MVTTGKRTRPRSFSCSCCFRNTEGRPMKSIEKVVVAFFILGAIEYATIRTANVFRCKIWDGPSRGSARRITILKA